MTMVELDTKPLRKIIHMLRELWHHFVVRAQDLDDHQLRDLGKQLRERISQVEGFEMMLHEELARARVAECAPTVDIHRLMCEAISARQFSDESRRGRLTIDVDDFLAYYNALKDGLPPPSATAFEKMELSDELKSCRAEVARLRNVLIRVRQVSYDEISPPANTPDCVVSRQEAVRRFSIGPDPNGYDLHNVDEVKG